MAFSNATNNILLSPFVPFTQQGTGAGVTTNSIPIPCGNISNLSWTANVGLSGGMPSGILKVQVTNELADPITGGAAPGTNGSGGTGWVDLPGSALNVGTGGNYFGNASLLGAAWCRISYVSASGGPAITVWVNGK